MDRVCVLFSVVAEGITATSVTGLDAKRTRLLGLGDDEDEGDATKL